MIVILSNRNSFSNNNNVPNNAGNNNVQNNNQTNNTQAPVAPSNPAPVEKPVEKPSAPVVTEP